MSKSNCANTRLFWNQDTGEVMLSPIGAGDPGKERYPRSGLACYTAFQKATFEQRKARLFIDFAHLVVRDGIDPIKLHHLFLELEEYRDGCACDLPGVMDALRKHNELAD